MKYALLLIALLSLQVQAADSITFTTKPGDRGTEACYAKNSFGELLFDVEGDGDVDLLELSHDAGAQNKDCLFINDGNGKFSLDRDASDDFTAYRGLGCVWTAQAIDLNGDNLQEVYCRGQYDAQDVFWNLSDSEDVMFQNKPLSISGLDSLYFADVNGDGALERHSTLVGKFNTVTTSAEIFPGTIIKSSDFYDVDNDSWPDLINFSTQEIYRNQNGTGYVLQGRVPEIALCTILNTRGVDYNKDGYEDLLCLRAIDNGPDVVILQNNKDYTFTRVDIPITDMWTLSTVDDMNKGSYLVEDFDNNGYFDIFVKTTLLMYSQISPGVFVKKEGNAVWPARTKSTFDGYGKAYMDGADINNDGLMDAVVAPLAIGSNYTSAILINNTVTSNKHLGIVLRGDAMGAGKNIDAIGARIIVKAAGTDTIIATHFVGNSWRRNGPNLVYHMGMGTFRAVDIEVKWPSGFEASQKFTNVETGHNYEITYATGNDALKSWGPGTSTPPVDPPPPPPITFSTTLESTLFYVTLNGLQTTPAANEAEAKIKAEVLLLLNPSAVVGFDEVRRSRVRANP